MAELDEPGDEPNLDLFGSFRLDFFSDGELLLTETDLTEQTETTEQTEQTEIGQLNDEDIDNFITENGKQNTTKKTQIRVTLTYFTGGYSYQKIEAKITIFFSDRE